MTPKQEEREKDLWKMTKEFLDSLHPEIRNKFTARLFVLLHLAEDNKGRKAKAMAAQVKPIKSWLSKVNKRMTKEIRLKIREDKKKHKEGGISWH